MDKDFYALRVVGSGFSLSDENVISRRCMFAHCDQNGRFEECGDFKVSYRCECGFTSPAVDLRHLVTWAIEVFRVTDYVEFNSDGNLFRLTR